MSVDHENEISDPEANLIALWREVGWRPILERALRESVNNNSFRNSANIHPYISRRPWVPHLLAQWVAADKECYQIGNRALTDSRWSAILRATYDYSDSTAPSHALKTLGLAGLRAIAFQQFIYQRVSAEGIGRQKEIAGRLPANSRIRTYIRNMTHFELDELAVHGYVLAHTATTSQDGTFALRESPYANDPRLRLRDYTQLLSASFDQLRERIPVARGISRPSALQLSAFTRYPIVQLSRRQYSWAPNFVTYAASHLVEYMLRESADKDLLRAYGDVFEKYVEDSLGRLKVSLLTEAKLRAASGTKDKLIDFVACTDKYIIFFEAKYKSEDPRSQVSNCTNQIGDRFASSIVKAFAQANSTYALYTKGAFASILPREVKEVVCIIVTSEQQYMATGDQIVTATGSRVGKAMGRPKSEQPELSIDNFILLSADGLDALVDCVAGEKLTLESFIDQMKASLESAQTRVIDPLQLLEKLLLGVESTRSDERLQKIVRGFEGLNGSP